ncbi:AAA family ATPase [Vallitalea guaymasensis]|uniref:AAA family ATPase n=1 Tax=Vallitalea guaymasensis TaxID=1185412 RepID=UPI000DE3C013|nr:AAA family ATPase [Vallitalea guaymasensis]
MNLIGRANQFIESEGKTITEIGKAINYSRPTVSRYLKGDYKSEDLEVALKRYLDEQQGLKDVKDIFQQPQFFESRDSTLTIGTCNSCQKYSGMGIVVGRTGYGKSHTLRHYAQLPKVAYIECDDSMANKDLIEAIERAIGLPTMYETIWKRVNNIREFFNVNKGYLLIIDEADKLISKYTQKKMEIIRAIFDQSDVGMIIAGEEKLEKDLKQYLERFSNRVDFYYKLQGLTREEIQKYFENADIEEAALKELIYRSTNKQNGCFRLLDRTLKNVLRIKGTLDIIKYEDIQKASSMMLL